MCSKTRVNEACATLLIVVAVVSFGIEAGAAECPTIHLPSTTCADGDPTCDLDGVCDGRCVITSCATTAGRASRLGYRIGRLGWDGLAIARVGQRVRAQAGICPQLERMVDCRPRRDGSHCKPRVRTCLVSPNSGPPTPTRCLIDSATRGFLALGEPGQTRIVLKLLDEPYRRDGGPGRVEAMIPTVVGRPGTFSIDDPDVPLWLVVSVADSYATRFDYGRLELTAVSPDPTIWIDEVHGSLELLATPSLHSYPPPYLRVTF